MTTTYRSRLTDNDRNWGPFTLARWRKQISLTYNGADEEYDCAYNSFTMVLFGWALRIILPCWVKPFKGGHEYRYGFSLSDMGNGYDFLQVFYGPQTWDSRTTKNWSKHLPWKQWDCVRCSVYEPNGTHFATEEKGKWLEFSALKEKCPAAYFHFEDYDGTKVLATCKIEEREWHRGEGWFKWLKYFYPAKIRRCLDLRFDKEIGPGKGSWKGGTIGTGCDMSKWDTPEDAFRRWCGGSHNHKGRDYQVKYLGHAAPP